MAGQGFEQKLCVFSRCDRGRVAALGIRPASLTPPAALRPAADRSSRCVFVPIVGSHSFIAAWWWNQTIKRSFLTWEFPSFVVFKNCLETFKEGLIICGFVFWQLTGVPLNVSIRLQLNLYIKSVSGITWGLFPTFSWIVFPLIQSRWQFPAFLAPLCVFLCVFLSFFQWNW